MTDNTELKRLAEAATQGEWQVIETELPCRIGRPHVERRIFTAKDHPQLKAPYPVVNGSVALGTDETPVHHMVSMTAEDAAFVAAANPAAVLALIAENERLERLALDSVNAEYAGSMDLESICAERDQLRAEVAGLKTGYEAYERVKAELKAEVERLDKLLMGAVGTLRKASSWICREVEAGTKSATYWAIRLRETADQIDAALVRGEQS